jgi:hypothetical protein
MIMRRNDDDFDDEHVLRDGHVGRVPMRMRDSSSRVTDAGLHRPGFRVADAGLRDERQMANDEYLFDLQNAWRGDARKKKIVSRDPEGRLLSEEEEELEDAMPALKGMTLDQVRHDHEQRMSGIYGAYDASIRENWRKP